MNTLDLLIDKIYSEKDENNNIIKNEEKRSLLLNEKLYRYSCSECCIC